MNPTDADLNAFLHRVFVAVTHDRIHVTVKAGEEAANELGWSQAEIIGQLCLLEVADFCRIEGSSVFAGDLVWVFTPESEVGVLWIRLIERHGIIVVSFHPW